MKTGIWVEPRDLVEAAQIRDLLVGEIEGISSELSEWAIKQKTVRYSRAEWALQLEWRARALHAKSEKLEQLRRLKQWMRDCKTSYLQLKSDSPIDPNDHIALLWLARRLVKRIATLYDHNYSEQDQAELDLISSYLAPRIKTSGRRSEK